MDEKKDGLDFDFRFGRIPPKSYFAQPRMGVFMSKTLSPLPCFRRPPVCIRMVAWCVPRPRLAGFNVKPISSGDCFFVQYGAVCCTASSCMTMYLHGHPGPFL